MNVFYYFILLTLHPYIAMWWKIFPKAGRKSWEALIPLYNYCIASKISGQPWWWGLFMIIPGIHLVMWAVFNVSLQRRFGYFSITETATGVFFPWINSYKIASDDSITYLPEMDWNNAELVKKREQGDHLVLFLSLPIIGHVIAYVLGSVSKRKKGAKTIIKEWGDAILFALVAATGIRTYVFEPFQIPTGSMEKTLLIGDFLFVNKLAYGPKVPVTPLSSPLVHNTIPWVNVRSYSTLQTSEYTRLPGWANIERFDVVVFNFPSGDTAVYDPRMPDGLMGHDYHGIVNDEALRMFYEEQTFPNYNAQQQALYNKIKERFNNPSEADSVFQIQNQKLKQILENQVDSIQGKFIENYAYWSNRARKYIAEDKKTHRQNEIISHYGVIYRPVDKRENYIKRCVGIPGDTLEIRDAQLYYNNTPAPIFDFQNLQYTAYNMPRLSEQTMLSRFGLESGKDYYGDVFFITEAEKQAILKAYPEVQFELYNPKVEDLGLLINGQKLNNLNLYPKSFNVSNTISNFDKFWVPQKGVTIPLNRHNIDWYKRVITAYEGHTLEEKDGKVYVDGKEATTYTFQMNYYWMMGDNRYNSADSRTWGFVPEDHIVGRAAIVWFSINQKYGMFGGGVRWDRVFKSIQ